MRLWTWMAWRVAPVVVLAACSCCVALPSPCPGPGPRPGPELSFSALGGFRLGSGRGRGWGLSGSAPWLSPWPHFLGMLRAIRDTRDPSPSAAAATNTTVAPPVVASTTAAISSESRRVARNSTGVETSGVGADAGADTGAGPDSNSWGELWSTAKSRVGSAAESASSFGQQASDKVSAAWFSVRSLTLSRSATESEGTPPPPPSWRGALDRLWQDRLSPAALAGAWTGAGAGAGAGAGGTGSVEVQGADHENSTSTADVADKDIANNAGNESESGQSGQVEADTGEAAGQQQQQTTLAERVKGVGHAVSTTVSRWSRAMASTLSSATEVVNSAVGTVLQVFNGGNVQGDSDHVCYSRLGCFSLREPWISPQRPLPKMNTPEEIQTKFFFFTRNLSDPEELVVSENMKSNNFLRGRKTFIIIHGFNDKSRSAWVGDMVEALLDTVDGNVILTDWSQGALASRNYLQAASNTRVAGVELGRLLEELAKQMATPLDVMHAIGHSLGAHIAGYAGKHLNGRLGRITALDAAQPAFEEQDPAVRVTATDARFVDVIHTNGAPFIPTLGLGMMGPLGHVDFYFNGGTTQPGCLVPKLPALGSLAEIAFLPVNVLGDFLSCSHRRAVEYFTEAIRGDCRMWARRRVEGAQNGDSDGQQSTTEVRAWSLGSLLPTPGFGLLASMFGDSRPTSTTEVPASSSSSSSPLSFVATLFGRPSSSPGSGPQPAVTTAQPPRATQATRKRKRPRPRPANNQNGSKRTGSQSQESSERRPENGNKPNKVNGSTESRAPGSKPRPTPRPTRRPTSRPKPPQHLPQHQHRPQQQHQPPQPPPASCQGACIPVGLDTDLYGLSGVFDIKTASQAPYCRQETANEV